VTGGGLAPDGTRWRPSKYRRFLFPVRALATVFRGNFLARLTALHRADRLLFAGQSAILREPAAWQRFLAELRATPWYVCAKAPLAGLARVLNYLARYTHRITISNERILVVDDAEVRVLVHRYRHHPLPALRSIPPRSARARPIRPAPATVMPHASHTRPDPIDDRVTSPSLRVAVVYLRPVPTTITAAAEALSVHPRALPTKPSRTVDRFVLVARARSAPRVPLPRRIVSP
jgi:hypothetical protein